MTFYAYNKIGIDTQTFLCYPRAMERNRRQANMTLRHWRLLLNYPNAKAYLLWNINRVAGFLFPPRLPVLRDAAEWSSWIEYEIDYRRMNYESSCGRAQIRMEEAN
ncbi:MAG: hypothetical protein OK457_00685 [Thaumarchaeota archaeon]|nr:hypothetical protein [Nitrososphaerota archaeon]